MKYKKKPVVINAVQHNGDFEIVKDWLDGLGVQEDEDPAIEQNSDNSLTIHTLEGDHRCDVGDWIIRGIKGEFYPCKPDIFEMTYELSTEPEEDPGRAICLRCGRVKTKGILCC